MAAPPHIHTGPNLDPSTPEDGSTKGLDAMLLLRAIARQIMPAHLEQIQQLAWLTVQNTTNRNMDWGKERQEAWVIGEMGAAP